MRRYLEDRFDLRAPELTTEEFLALAGSASNLSRDHQLLLRDFLRQADLVKFAGVRASEDEIRRSSDLAVRFLEETRENAPLIDDPDAAGDWRRPPAARRRQVPIQVPVSRRRRMFDWELRDPWFLLLRCSPARLLAGHTFRLAAGVLVTDPAGARQAVLAAAVVARTRQCCSRWRWCAWSSPWRGRAHRSVKRGSRATGSPS